MAAGVELNEQLFCVNWNWRRFSLALTICANIYVISPLAQLTSIYFPFKGSPQKYKRNSGFSCFNPSTCLEDINKIKYAISVYWILKRFTFLSVGEWKRQSNANTHFGPPVSRKVVLSIDKYLCVYFRYIYLMVQHWNIMIILSKHNLSVITVYRPEWSVIWKWEIKPRYSIEELTMRCVVYFQTLFVPHFKHINSFDSTHWQCFARLVQFNWKHCFIPGYSSNCPFSRPFSIFKMMLDVQSIW